MKESLIAFTVYGRRKATVALAVLLLLDVSGAVAQLSPGPNDLYVRVVDVGAGLCTVTQTPGNHYMVYDAGHWTGNHCLTSVRDIVDGDEIDLLIISHSDADHLGEAREILEEFDVRRIITTGFERWDSRSWREMNQAIAEEVQFVGASVLNLRTVELVPGTAIEVGDATITLVAGWHEWTSSGPTASERRNAISIVVRLEYDGKSVLYTGDTVGRKLGDPDAACKDAEAFMVQNASAVPIQADVLIAPHHGGNNGSSSCFIAEVDPDFVIFSAGHSHEHPTAGAAGRYLAHGVQIQNIFRTDRGDDEGGFEWPHGAIAGCRNRPGNDDVEIVLPLNGSSQVAYRQGAAGC